MAQVAVTPIKASMHWDDQKQRWDIKASRQTKENGQFKEWEALLEKALTLAEVILLILQFWQMTSTGTFAAPLGDPSALIGLLQGADATGTLSANPSLNPSAVYGGTVLEGTEYDGEADQPKWGTTV